MVSDRWEADLSRRTRRHPDSRARAPAPAGEFLLDGRAPEEGAELDQLHEAVNIPLGQFRDHLGELPHDRRIVAYCQKNQRRYPVTCLLRGIVFEKTANLRGGYLQAQLNGLACKKPA